jgi:hypothetical protein
MRDGRVRSDKPVQNRHIAPDELVKHEAAEAAANLGEEPAA